MTRRTAIWAVALAVTGAAFLAVGQPAEAKKKGPPECIVTPGSYVDPEKDGRPVDPGPPPRPNDGKGDNNKGGKKVGQQVCGLGALPND